MRPGNGIGIESALRPRKQSSDADPVSAPSSGPTTFFLASESDLARRSSVTSHAVPQTPPVRSLKETHSEAAAEIRTSPARAFSQAKPPRDGSRRRSTIRPRSIEELRREANIQRASSIAPSPDILTPAASASQDPSLPSSPKSISSRSFTKDDDDSGHDDHSSQAIESEEEEGEENEVENATQSATSLQDSAPQLIMPSIRMPSRRPFTHRGKQLGRFKIMVVGSQGSGKTSLIKSIVQVCEDIVHVDPLSVTPHTPSRSSGKSTAHAFTETYASTKPYPSWWSEMDESSLLKRRKSMGDAVLERNICFVDTAHHRSPAFAAHYIEQQLHKTINYANQASGELTSLLSGRGGTQVDLVLYLISYDTVDDDVQHLQHISRLANVVPLVAKADLLTSEQIDEVRSKTSTDFSLVSRLPISFSPVMELGSQQATAAAPYTVSCVNGPDYDNMDASLLMSSEYVQPLLPSELHLLVDQIFTPENVAFFRHVAAKKLVAWHNSGFRLEESVRTQSPSSARSPAPSTLNSPMQHSLSASGVLVPVTSQSQLSLNTSNSFALAKVADHTQKEERLAQIRLSKWASDLQLSLQRERERYESLARSERAIWLVERMGEEIKDGQLVPISDSLARDAEDTQSHRGKRFIYRDGAMNVAYHVHDPLGLLRWQDALRAQTWLALQVVGSFGVVGGLALWLTKQWGYDSSFHQWARDWGLWHD